MEDYLNYACGNEPCVGDKVLYLGRPFRVVMVQGQGVNLAGHEYLVKMEELTLKERRFN